MSNLQVDADRTVFKISRPQLSLSLQSSWALISKRIKTSACENCCESNKHGNVTEYNMRGKEGRQGLNVALWGVTLELRPQTHPGAFTLGYGGAEIGPLSPTPQSSCEQPLPRLLEGQPEQSGSDLCAPLVGTEATDKQINEHDSLLHGMCWARSRGALDSRPRL